MPPLKVTLLFFGENAHLRFFGIIQWFCSHFREFCDKIGIFCRHATGQPLPDCTLSGSKGIYPS
jgi:hypothetical protein